MTDYLTKKRCLQHLEYLIALFYLLWCPPLFAAEKIVITPEALTPCAESSSAPTDSWLDRTHTTWSERVCNTAVHFDRFFGDTRYDSEYASSLVRVYNSFSLTQKDSTILAFNPRIRARIALPNLQEKFNLLISDDTQDQDALSPSAEILPEHNSNNHYSATLRWIAQTEKKHQLDLDVGTRFNHGLQFFTQTRFRYYYILNEAERWNFSETLFWRAREGFGERSQLDFDHLLAANKLFRWTSAATFSESTQGVDWLEQFTLFQQLDVKQALSYTFAFSGFTIPAFTTENYGISARYRRNIYSNWLYLELEPQLNWPLDQQHEFTPAFILRIEAQFGQQ